MSTYTIEIYLAGLLAFAASQNPNGIVDSVTVLALQPGVEEHVPFIAWPESDVHDSCNQANAISSKLSLTGNGPNGWGGCLLDREEISLAAAGGQTQSAFQSKWTSFRLDPCMMGPATRAEFCWVPVIGQLGDESSGKIDKKFLSEPLEKVKLAARLHIDSGRLMTYHLAERGGRVPAFKFQPSARPVERVIGDISVWQIEVDEGQAVSLTLKKSTGGSRTIAILPAAAGQTRRILIGNLAPKEPPPSGPEPSQETVDHFNHWYDLLQVAPPHRTLPVWDKLNSPSWAASQFDNPEFCDMPSPLKEIYEGFSGVCKQGKVQTPFQRPTCPSATFTVDK